jgi:hypothetical protein
VLQQHLQCPAFTDDNTNVDNADNSVLLNTVPIFTTSTGTTPINASNPPITIAQTDVDLCSTGSQGISNSIFTELNYTWIDRECWVPYVGIGFKAEFGSTGNQFCPNVANVTVTNSSGVVCNNCDNCASCAVSKWAIWIQGGVSFN